MGLARFCAENFEQNLNRKGVMPQMKPITVVDARMGRGKSSAAIRYMNRYKGLKRFLYITPYLKEVERICEMCDFEQPDSDHLSKSIELKGHMRKGHNIAATHSLFYLMDEEALELVRRYNYSLIIDETIEVIERFNITSKDFDLIVGHLAEEHDGGLLRWLDKDYSGKFSGYKDAADTGSLFRLDSALLNIMNPYMLQAFDEVFMLTYMFEGQYQKAYLDFFGFEYNIVGVERDDDGYYFSDRPDEPPAVDYYNLINIVDKAQSNAPGDGKYALSKNWYAKRGRSDKDIKLLRRGLRNFFEGSGGNSGSRLWTCFKEEQSKLIAESGRYRNNFLQISARATNEYRDKTDVAYMVNRFADPNVTKFFASRGIEIDQDAFALSEMLQWIWRSAIRDDKPINLYVPSSRMRELLINWIDNTKGGRPD